MYTFAHNNNDNVEDLKAMCCSIHEKDKNYEVIHIEG